MGKGGEKRRVVAKGILIVYISTVRENPCFMPTCCSHTAKAENDDIFFKTYWC